MGVLLEYPTAPADSPPRAAASIVRAGTGAAPRGRCDRRLAIGLIGAGNYASSMLLPNLARLDNAYLAHVATTRSLSAVTHSGASVAPAQSTRTQALCSRTRHWMPSSL